MSRGYQVICECNRTLVVRHDMLGQIRKCPSCGLTIPICGVLRTGLGAFLKRRKGGTALGSEWAICAAATQRG